MIMNKKKLIKHKIEMIESLIMDKEIDIEVGWILLRQSEREKAELIKQIKENTKEMISEQNKKKIDMDKVKELNKKNIELGWTGEKKGNEEVYKGQIQFKDNQVKNFYNEITKLVGEREFLKMRLSAIIKYQNK